MKVNVGDKFLVRKDLVDEKYYGADCFIREMRGGKVVTISEVIEPHGYTVNEDYFRYTPEMFDSRVIPIKSVSELKPGDSILIREDLKEGFQGYGGYNFNRYMLDTIGKVVTVEKVFNWKEPSVGILENPWYYHSTMIAGKVVPLSYNECKPYPSQDNDKAVFDVSVALVIERVIYSPPATVLFYSDPDGITRKVVAMCNPKDEYSEEVGLEKACLKALIAITKRRLHS